MEISSFLYKFSIKNPVENNNDPLFKMINTFKMIIEINNSYEEDNEKCFYFNKDKIHRLLYELEEVIKINKVPNKFLVNNNISELFYLELLILDNQDSINYVYSIEIIKSINNLIKNTNSKLKKMLLSKIALTLIFNFKGSEEYDEESEDELNEIEKENIDNIKNNLEILKELNCNYGLNDVKDAKIDNIYLAILISLIKQSKFNDYNYIEDILNQLNLDSINITNVMLKGLSEEINIEKNSFLNEYMINDINNLKNEKLINFYYIIIVKVLKNPIYISKIEFLEKNRKNLIELIKNNKNKIINLQLSLDLKSKIKSILKTIYNEYFYEKYFNVQKVQIPEKKNEESIIIVDSQYNPNEVDQSEINKYSQSNINDILKEDKKLNDEKGIIFEAKEEPNETEDIENKTKCQYETAVELTNYTRIEISIVKNENGGPKIKKEKFFYGKKNIEIQRKDLYENANYDELTEDDKKNKDAPIVYKNYKKLLWLIKEIEDCINNSEIKFNPRFEIILEKQNDSSINDNSENKDYYDILCTSIFINQLDNNRKLEFIDRNVLVNGLDGKCNGFSFLVNELSNDDYEDETFKYDDD